MTQTVASVNNLGDSVLLAVTNALNVLLGAIPLIIGALIVLVIGWLISNALAGLTASALRRAGADRLFAEHGGRAYGEAANRLVPSRAGSEIVRWVVRLVALVAACNTLGLPQFSLLLNQVLLWIPNLIVAAIILLVAPVLGRFVRSLIETGAGDMGFTNGRLLGRLAEIAIIAFAALIAINQVGIAQNLIDILFIGLVGAIALAFGLAFGLGGRDVAADVTRQWYESSRSKAQEVAERRRPTVDGRPLPRGGFVPGTGRAK